MRNRITLIALFLCSTAMCQDTICLPRHNYIEIYKGLKAKDYYKESYNNCLDVANQLNGVIKQQNDSLQLSMHRLEEAEYELDYLNYQYHEAIKKQPVVWYKSAWFWGGAGLLTGLILK